ncbi:MAG: FHA domain-containing protein [Candidatus Nanopelagicales bacterium]|nr:FHA domain-containing protein [Candidatus Nanopelagicales bacterium]MDZ4250031.1 FHA domain-containing protein [Candidatus Nanopelagicales bacterium]
MSNQPESEAERTANIEITRCSSCHRVIEPGSRFCSSCGAELDRSGETVASSSTQFGDPVPVIDPEVLTGIAPGDGVLVVIRGADEGARFPLNQSEVSVGRAADASVFLDDVTVSRRHAEITRTEDGWMLSDVASLNGSYVNRTRTESALLRSGDEVQIGKYRFVFYQAPA